MASVTHDSQQHAVPHEAISLSFPISRTFTQEQTTPLDFNQLKLPPREILSPKTLADEISFLRSLAHSDLPLLPQQRRGTERVVSIDARAEERTIATRETFKRYADPLIIPGRTDTILIAYGGLTTPNYAIRRLMIETYRRFGCYTEIHSLYGNDGEPNSLLNVHAHDMVNHLEERVAKVRKLCRGSTPPKIILVGYSTGFLACTVVAQKHQDLVSGLVGLGAPLTLKTPTHRFGLPLVDFVDDSLVRWAYHMENLERAIPASIFDSLGKKLLNLSTKIRQALYPMIEEGLESQPKEMRKTPHYRRIPMANLLAFYRLQKMALETIRTDGFHCPTFAAWGDKDRFCSSRGTEIVKKAFASTSEQQPVQSEMKVYAQSPHPIFFGPAQYELKHDMWRFIHSIETRSNHSVAPPNRYHLPSGSEIRANSQKP